MNKKIYWGSAAVLSFIALATLSGGYSLISDFSGKELGFELPTSALLPNFKILGYFFTYAFGFGGMALLSFSFKRFKTYAIGILIYGVLLFFVSVFSVFVYKTQYPLFGIFSFIGLLLMFLAKKIEKQLKKLKQW